MTSDARLAQRRTRLLGGALGAALAAGLIAPAAASAGASAPGFSSVAPMLAATSRSAASAATASGAANSEATTPSATRTSAVAVKAVTQQRVALSSAEARMLVLINAQRVSRHLVPLAEAAGPTDVARRWSAELAASGTLSHNPALIGQLQAAGGGNWHWLAENVGVAPAGETDPLFAAYMASPHHRENILDPRARFIGLGTVTDASGSSWNTMDFIDSYSGAYGVARTRPAA